jgi:hypothetical protein
MFKRHKTEPEEAPASTLHSYASTPAKPAMPGEPGPTEAAERTTCYPQDGGIPPPVLGEPRTTVYRQALPWSRRGYDTVN